MNLKPLLLLLSLPLMACSTITTPAQANHPKINTYGCQNLHKVMDIDDLLKQMYDNLDSHCLFEMDTHDLETIWGIRVFDSASGESSRTELRDYLDNRNALLVKRYSFGNPYINIYTSDKYNQAHNGVGGSISAGKLPKYLPPPIGRYTPPVHENIIWDDRFKVTNYDAYYTYFWQNSLKSSELPFIMLTMEDNPKKPRMTLYHDSKDWDAINKLLQLDPVPLTKTVTE